MPIDLRRLVTAFATVCYRNNGVRLGLAGNDVAMLLWKASDSGGATTLLTWRV